MKTVLRAAALTLVLIMLLPFTGCSCVFGAPPAANTPAPTVTAEPTPKVTAAFGVPDTTPPVTPDPLKYSFDPETLLFQDGFVSFTLPEGLTLIEGAERDGERSSILFVSEDGAFPCVRYAAEPIPYEGMLDNISRETLIMDCEQEFLGNYGEPVEITPVSFSKTPPEGPVRELVFEYTFLLFGEKMRALTWLGDTQKGHVVRLTYCWYDDSDLTPTLSSIVLK